MQFKISCVNDSTVCFVALSPSLETASFPWHHTPSTWATARHIHQPAYSVRTLVYFANEKNNNHPWWQLQSFRAPTWLKPELNRPIWQERFYVRDTINSLRQRQSIKHLAVRRVIHLRKHEKLYCVNLVSVHCELVSMVKDFGELLVGHIEICLREMI